MNMKHFMKKKKILIIAGGEWQVPVINKAKSMGLITVVTDRGAHAPGLQIADFPEVVDIIDMKGTLAVAEKYLVDAVITEQTDVSVPTAAFVAEKLGLPGIGYEVSLRATNKYLMREACSKANIPMPKYEKVDILSEALEAAEAIGYPIIIKPVDGQASRGVRQINKADELKSFFASTKENSRDGAVLIEECVVGIESTIEGFISKKKPYMLAISDKTHLPPPVCVAINLTYPAAFSEKLTNRLSDLSSQVVKALGMPMGITHGEFMITEDGPKFIEMAARGGGSRISSHIVPAISGVDVVEGVIKQALGESYPISNISSKAAILEFFTIPKGTLKRIVGIKEALQIPGVMEINFQVKQGDKIPEINNDRIRPGFFIVTGKNRSEVNEIANQVREHIIIELK